MTDPETIVRTVSVEEFNRYMEFDSSEQDPWRAELMPQQLAVLGAERPEVSTEEAAGLRDCYDNQNRSYHDESHGRFMGQADVPESLAVQLSPAAREWAGDMLAVAGLWHDAAYKQVDTSPDSDTGEGAWHPFISGLIGEYARYERTVEGDRPVFRTHLTEVGRQDQLTSMVAHVFGFDEHMVAQGIVHNQGGNEFDSALAVAKFLEAKGTPTHMIVGVVAGIAATVPFKPARGDMTGSTPDGHMGELAERVESALRSGDQGAWPQTNDIMLLAVHLANRDVAPFILPDEFALVINGGRKVKKEEVEELRTQVSDIGQLVRAASIERSAPLLYQWMGEGGGPVSAENVPHFYIPRDEQGVPQLAKAYPPLPVYEQAVLNAERNTNLASLFFQVHEAGIALAASLATMVGEPNAEVPGFVHAALWRDEAEPTPQPNAQLSEREQAVYLTLLHGIGQEKVDEATPVRSPISGVLLGALGPSGIRELSGRIRQLRNAHQEADGGNPFADAEVAEAMVNEVVERIGEHNFEVIIGELEHVARTFAARPDRAEALNRLTARYGNR